MEPETMFNFKDFIDVDITINSDEQKQKYNHELVLMDWTETHIQVQINFTDPLIISSGMFPDQLVCKIINSSMLIDSDTGVKIETVE